MNIITADIESSPDIAYTFGQKWKPNIVEYKDFSRLLGFSVKILDGKQTTRTLLDGSEKALVRDLWSFLDKADLVIGYNSDKFDIRKLNTYFAKHGLPPPSPYKSIDLLKTVRTKFLLPSNRLDDFLRYFKLESKLENEKNLFIKCCEGDRKAFKQLAKYNAHDTLITEKAFKFLRPWIKNLNVGIYHENTVCSRCGSRNVIRRGYQQNLTTTYPRIRCNDCNGWSTLRLNVRELKPLTSI